MKHDPSLLTVSLNSSPFWMKSASSLRMILMQTSAILALLAPLSSSAVIGRDEARPVVLSSLVGIGYESTEDISCTGAVIDSHHVLTAAHCAPKKDSSLFVSTLETDHSKRLKLPVTKVSISPEYRWKDGVYHFRTERSNAGNDLMLLRLDVPLPERMTPVKIAGLTPPQGRFDFSGVGTGYSTDRFGSLKEVIAESSAQGRRLWDNFNLRRLSGSSRIDGHFGTLHFRSEPGTAICKGDSGSVLFREKDDHLVVYGVASRLHTGRAEVKMGRLDTRCSRHVVFTPAKAIRGFLQFMETAESR